MAKIYSKKSLVSQTMKPSEETLSFLLNYSKALSIVRIKNVDIEIISN
ncbi:hypothetical protein [Flavobacterium weaverense]|uniref:Uncharacterized protein n=1 Tax=Flavobacterium weaverense TaxID=271156 RepID=A0A3L9ZV70_9FLAO|nr:hypothetical protein [Flavobacterium weaverense]RMA76260.1 hypothetical protein BC961_1988 [Flavobacterium weaverense]